MIVTEPTMKLSLIATVASLSMLIGVAHAENPMVGGAPMYADKNIVENAVNSKDHTTLVAAVKAAGLVETLSGAGPFTVFAPANAAFETLPEGTVENLLKPENKEQLTKILTCHVLAADAMAKVIMKMVDDDKGAHPVKTVGGCTFTAKYEGEGDDRGRKRERCNGNDRGCRPIKWRHPRDRYGSAAKDVSWS